VLPDATHAARSKITTMKMHRGHLLVVAAFALFTNGSTLLGFGTGSAGALARTLESLSKLSRSIELRQALEALDDRPPRGPGDTFATPFLPV